MQYSTNNLIETADFPVLVKGGPSSSDTLNRINQAIQRDIIRLNMNVQEQERRQQMVATYLDQQVLGIQGMVNHLASLLPSAPANRGLADFYSADYIHATNTAEIDEDYGMATLPIRSVQEKMHHVDQSGQIWIPEDSRLRFFSSSVYIPNAIPEDSLFYSSTEDFRGIHGSPDNFFLGGNLRSQAYLYVKATLPQTLNTHRLANRITVHPIPSFSHTLVAVYIRPSANAWTYVSKSGMPWLNGSNEVEFCGPFRLTFTPTEISEVCLVFKANQWWGFQEFSVQLVEYDTSANLVVDFSSYSPGAITAITLNGRNTSTLNALPYTINGSVVTIPLTQIAAYNTPVITSIEALWS